MALTIQAVKLRVNLRSPSFVKCVKWVDYLNSDRFKNKITREFHSRGSPVQRLTKDARTIIRDEVYSYSPTTEGYERSYNLLNSFRATQNVHGKDIAGLALFSDLDRKGTATRWSIHGTVEDKYRQTISYATYFLKPAQLESFIRQSGQRYRPFHHSLWKMFSNTTREQAKLAINNAVEKGKP